MSLIRSKYENRFSYRFDAEAEASLADEIRLVAGRRFDKGRWLERPDVARVEALFARIYEGAPFLLLERDEFHAPTRARPRSWAVYHSRLHAVAGDDRCVRLAASSMSATRKFVSYKSSRSLYSWTFHAQARMHERTPRDVKADREIGKSILDCCAFLEVFNNHRARVGSRAGIAIPCGDGLLLGKYATVDPDLPVFHWIHSDRDSLRNGRFPFKEMDQPRIGAEAEGNASAFMGVTYVGPDEMRPEQVEYRSRVERICEALRPRSLAMARSYSGIGVSAVVTPPVDGRNPALPEVDPSTEASVRALLVDPSASWAVREQDLAQPPPSSAVP